MGKMHVLFEVRSRGLHCECHNVPSNLHSPEVVDGRKHARHVIGVVIRSRSRTGLVDMTVCQSQRCGQFHRLELRDIARRVATQRAKACLGSAQTIHFGAKEQIEAGTFIQLGQVQTQTVQIQLGACWPLRQATSTPLMPVAASEHAKDHLWTGARHCRSPSVIPS